MEFTVGKSTLYFHEESKKLVVNGKEYFPSQRSYGEMKKLYAQTMPIEDNFGMYYMFRGVYLSDQDKEIFESNKLRYDITIIPPRLIGNEYNKTYGHVHLGGQMETYEVILGKALYLQQSDEKVFFTQVKTGQTIIMQSGFGHLTINPDEARYLVMANIVSTEVTAVYDKYTEKCGGHYLYKMTGWQKNMNYTSDIPLEEGADIFDQSDIYADFIQNPENYNFLQ